MQDYWLKQQQDKPLFQDISWARPENRHAAGKLLIVGGNMHGFLDVGMAYQLAVQAGAGSVKVLLPDALAKTVGMTLENCEYAPSTLSGGFASTALNELLVHAQWADMVLLAGEFGRNSETAIMLEAFVQKYHGPLTITRDALDYFYHHAGLILDREGTCIVGATGQLQKLAQNSKYTQAITTSLDLVRLVDILHDFETKHAAYIVTHHLGTTVIAASTKVSTTKTGDNDELWRIPAAAASAVFLMQHPSKPFEALTTSLL